MCTALVLVLVYSNFIREVRLGGWGTEGPKALTLGQYVRVRAPPFRRKVEWKYILRFESIYFFVEIGFSPGLNRAIYKD